MKNPITPSDCNDEVKLKYQTEEAVEYFNARLLRQEWHRQVNAIDGYHAIAIAPCWRWEKEILDNVVKVFNEAGWDCKWSNAYDARGPHQCFYVSEKHFQNEAVAL